MRQTQPQNGDATIPAKRLFTGLSNTNKKNELFYNIAFFGPRKLLRKVKFPPTNASSPTPTKALSFSSADSAVTTTQCNRLLLQEKSVNKKTTSQTPP